MSQSDESEIPTKLISTLKANKWLERECQKYLSYIMNKKVEPIDVQKIPMVRKFLEVFPREFSGLHL